MIPLPNWCNSPGPTLTTDAEKQLVLAGAAMLVKALALSIENLRCAIPSLPHPEAQAASWTLLRGQVLSLQLVGVLPSYFNTAGAPYNVSIDGTPCFKQGDPAWGQRLLGAMKGADARTIASRGCAMTSVAMALSKVLRRTITPLDLDAHLDSHDGYLGNALKWNVAGTLNRPNVEVAKSVAWSLARITAELDAGRPVVLGVDYKPGSSGGGLGTDHWVCLTGRIGHMYFANDPATGEEITFLETAKQGLAAERWGQAAPYFNSGEFTLFRAPPAKS